MLRKAGSSGVSAQGMQPGPAPAMQVHVHHIPRGQPSPYLPLRAATKHAGFAPSHKILAAVKLFHRKPDFSAEGGLLSSQLIVSKKCFPVS